MLEALTFEALGQGLGAFSKSSGLLSGGMFSGGGEPSSTAISGGPFTESPMYSSAGKNSNSGTEKLILIVGLIALALLATKGK